MLKYAQIRMLTYADALALQQLLALPQLHGRGERQVVNSLTLPLAPPIRPLQARHTIYVLVCLQICTVLACSSVLTLPTIFPPPPHTNSSASDSPRPSRHTEATLGPARSGSQTAAQDSALRAAERRREHPLSGACRLAKEVRVEKTKSCA